MERVCIGKIATAHGVRGLVKLHVFADDPTLLNGSLYTGESGDKTLSLSLKNATAKHWLAEIDGVSDRTEAEKLRGTGLYIDKDKLPEPEDDEYYIEDLIGLHCQDESGHKIGQIIDVQNFGAGDLLDIRPDTGGESFYLPFHDETIIAVEDDHLVIRIPEGLLS